MISEYKIIRQVNKDEVKITYLVEKGGDKFFLKKVDLTKIHESEVDSFEKLFDKLAKINNKYIEKVFQYQKENGYYFIVSEYIVGEPLSSIRKKFSLADSVFLFENLLDDVRELHKTVLFMEI